MNRNCVLTLLLFCTAMLSGQVKKQTSMNPLLNKYDTPYGVPPFASIRPEHFEPALEQAMRDHKSELKKITENTEAATFDNTIVALENAGELLGNINRVLSNLNSAHTSKELQDIAKLMAPKLSAHNDNIYLNERLFKRVRAVWNDRNQLNLDTEQLMLVGKKYKAFVRSGAALSEDKKQQLRKLNSELAVTTLSYGQNVLAETNAYELLLTDKKDLAGLPADLLASAQAGAKAKGKTGWLFTLSNSSVMPFLQYSSNRALRKQIWDAYQTRANHDNASDNKANAVKLANLRGEKARLLGYKSYADYGLEETMAKTPENALQLLQQLWKPAVEMAHAETAAIQELMKKDKIKDNVQPYDWRYYAEKIRKQRYDLDEQEVKPYFSLNAVRDGIFTVVDKLYGLKFKEVQNVPKYHEDVTVWEVTEADGTLTGLLYMDMAARESKRGGAWMTSYRNQSRVNGKRQEPVISIVCNFPKQVGNDPVLLTFDEVTTFFHEFGHALHGLLSDVQYKSLAGTSVSRDFVELPSQIMENWASEPEVLKMYARHYKTGAVIPDALIQKMVNAQTFDQGFATTEYLAASFLDMDYHSQTTEITTDANSFEAASMAKIALPSSIIPRYRSTYFTHIFSGGYSAGYYSYIWSAVLDTDAFAAFTSTSLFDKATAKSFRENILERGGTDEAMKMYVKFRGQEPGIGPLLRKRGLDKPTQKPVKIKG